MISQQQEGVLQGTGLQVRTGQEGWRAGTTHTTGLQLTGTQQDAWQGLGTRQAGLQPEATGAARGRAAAGRPAQQSHAGGTAGAPAAQGRTADSRTGRLAALGAAGVAHGGMGLGGVRAEDRAGPEAPSPGPPPYPGCGVLATRHLGVFLVATCCLSSSSPTRVSSWGFQWQ